MRTLRTLSLVSAAAIAVGLTNPALSGEITFLEWSPGINSVALEPIPLLVTANNDDVVGTSPNKVLVYQKDYQTFDPVDIVFTVVNSGGTTEYEITEGVQNGTGTGWSGYHLQLGFGVGAGFVKSTPLDGLDFDYDPVPSSSYNSPASFNPLPADFATVLRPTEDDLIATDGFLADGMYAGNYFIFHIDVPDGITEFTLRQEPLPIPEPGSAAVLALLSGLALRRRR